MPCAIRLYVSFGNCIDITIDDSCVLAAVRLQLHIKASVCLGFFITENTIFLRV